jgi:hypothetical protein
VDDPAMPNGWTARLTVPLAEFNFPGAADWYDVTITLQAHPTNDLSVLAFVMGHRNMAGQVYELDGGPIVQSGPWVIGYGVDEVVGPVSMYLDPAKDVIFEISYTDAQGGDWVPLSTNLVAGHYAYTVSTIPTTYTEITNDSGKRGLVNKIVAV